MAAPTILLPGEGIDISVLPRSKKGTLTLGPGLRHLPPNTIRSTTSGTLQVDYKKSALWLDHPTGGRYQPSIGDLVIAQVHRFTQESYSCSITAHTAYAQLGQLAFEGANKKNRPQLNMDDLVYARVLRASKWDDTEIECVNSATGKAEGMGPLKGGMVFDVSPAFARRLMMGSKKGSVRILEDLGEKLRFEVAVGRNGRVWVDSGSVKETVLIGKALQMADRQNLSMENQRILVKKMLQEG